MDKKILTDLAVYLKKNNIMICSSRGEISLLHDVHGPDREMFSTGRNSINSYDAELLGEECVAAPVVPMPDITPKRLTGVAFVWATALIDHAENYTWFLDGSCRCDTCGVYSSESDIGTIEHMATDGKSCETGISWDLLPDAQLAQVQTFIENDKKRMAQEAKTVPLEIVQKLWNAVTEGRSVMAWEELRDQLKVAGVKVAGDLRDCQHCERKYDTCCICTAAEKRLNKMILEDEGVLIVNSEKSEVDNADFIKKLHVLFRRATKMGLEIPEAVIVETESSRAYRKSGDGRVRPNLLSMSGCVSEFGSPERRKVGPFLILNYRSIYCKECIVSTGCTGPFLRLTDYGSRYEAFCPTRFSLDGMTSNPGK